VDLIQLGIEISFVLERFFCCHVQELCHVAYKYVLVTIDNNDNQLSTILLNPNDALVFLYFPIFFN
jgi:hypothetical protein